MANSRIGQYQIEFTLNGYTSPTRTHALRVWVSPQGTPAVGAAPTAIDIMKRGGTTANLQVVADQFWGFIRLSYATTITAVSYTLWKFVTQNSRDFITAGTLTTPAGSTGTTVVAHQVTLTFRHALGGIGKIVLLESTQSGVNTNSLVPNTLGTPVQRLAAYLMSADSPMIALDNSFTVSPLRDSRGENEALSQLIYR